MDAGVTLEIRRRVDRSRSHVGADSRIEPCVQLLGKTRIGPGCTIRTGSVLADAVLEDNVVVKPHTMVMRAISPRDAGRAVRASRDGARLEENRAWKFRGGEEERAREGVKSMH